jgi:hypothetical protein
MWLLIAVLVSVLAVSPLIIVAAAAAAAAAAAPPATASWRRGPGRRRGPQRPTHVHDVALAPLQFSIAES